MILTIWPEGVNTRFYSMSSKPKENTETIEFSSGRVVAWQKNTKKQMTYTAKIMLNLDTELNAFWTWFNDTLGQTAGAFLCAALGSGRYRFTSIPEPDDTDQANRVLSLEFEEVY